MKMMAFVRMPSSCNVQCPCQHPCSKKKKAKSKGVRLEKILGFPKPWGVCVNIRKMKPLPEEMEGGKSPP